MWCQQQQSRDDIVHFVIHVIWYNLGKCSWNSRYTIHASASCAVWNRRYS